MNVWSRKVVAWDVESSEDPKLAASFIGWDCLRERITRRRKQPLILHADNGNAMLTATLEVRLEELDMLRSFSRSRVSNDNPYSESLFRTIKYRPDYPRMPFTSKEKACMWVVDFVNWFNNRYRHSGIKLVMPDQRHNGEAVEICEHSGRVYEQAGELHPK